jgi:hypothetical protein
LNVLVEMGEDGAMRVYAVDHPELAPLEMPARFSHDVAYFMTPPGERGAPRLPSGEYWINSDDARRWLDEGVLSLVSPLDSENQAEVEISEDHERWLEWLLENKVQHVRLSP